MDGLTVDRPGQCAQITCSQALFPHDLRFRSRRCGARAVQMASVADDMNGWMVDLPKVSVANNLMGRL
jgi:hypothetical protein